MISVTWMIDIDRNTEYLECRDETPGKETDDIVKVYFVSGFDIDTIKGRNLEMDIAKTIFSNREKYGNVLTGQLEMFPNSIFFETYASALLNRE